MRVCGYITTAEDFDCCCCCVYIYSNAKLFATQNNSESGEMGAVKEPKKNGK